MMLLKNTFKCICICICFLVSSFSNAVVDTRINVSSFQSGASYRGPADASGFATTLNTWGSIASANICSNQTLNYSVNRIDLVTMIPYTGRSIPASTSFRERYLYEVGVPGLAYSFRILGGWLSDSMVHNDYLIPGRHTVFSEVRSNEARVTSFPSGVSAQLLKDAGRVLDGQTFIPGQVLFVYECYDTNNVLQETTTIYQQPYTFYSYVTTCVPKQNVHTIQMRDLRLEDVETAAIGTIFETVRQSFSLICDDNIKVYQTINDLVNPTNVTNISTLTSDSTAKGIAYQVLSGTTSNVYSFSTPGSTPGYGTRSEYYINESTSQNQSISHDLRFSYIKTDNEVSEGTVKSIIGITYSYQ